MTNDVIDSVNEATGVLERARDDSAEDEEELTSWFKKYRHQMSAEMIEDYPFDIDEPVKVVAPCWAHDMAACTVCHESGMSDISELAKTIYAPKVKDMFSSVHVKGIDRDNKTITLTSTPPTMPDLLRMQEDSDAAAEIDARYSGFSKVIKMAAVHVHNSSEPCPRCLEINSDIEARNKSISDALKWAYSSTCPVNYGDIQARSLMEPICECGAHSTGVKAFMHGHSSYCPAHESKGHG